MNITTAMEADEKDLLMALPTELLCEVLSYLTAPYANVPNISGLHFNETSSARRLVKIRKRASMENRERAKKGRKPLQVKKPLGHPFLTLAQCSNFLREFVEDYCLQLLVDNKAITKFKGLGESREEDEGLKERTESHRGYWHHFVINNCLFCGKQTELAATFNCLINCCDMCEKKEFPELITRGEVLYGGVYNLSRRDLVNDQGYHIYKYSNSYNFSGMKPWPGSRVKHLRVHRHLKLKTLRYAARTPGIENVMFYKHEVEERASILGRI